MEWLRTLGPEAEPGAIERAARVLKSGGLVIYPTDTLYGIAVDPRVFTAVERVFTVKGRPGGQPLPLVAGTPEQAGRVAELSDAAWRLAERFWPGPLTLVALARPGLADGVASHDGSVAIRVPDHPVARRLADALGFAITATSANVSGRAPSRVAEEAAAGLWEHVDLVLDGGATPGGPPSTIVDARVTPPRLVRDGAVPFGLVLQALARP